MRGIYPRVEISQTSSLKQPLIRRHSRSFASAFLRTAAEAAYATFSRKGRRKKVRSYFLVLAFFAFFTGSLGAFFSTFTATGVLAAIRIDRA